VRYVSTRGQAPSLGFGDVLLSGLATDGGLYVPEAWPALDPALWAAPRPYAEVAAEVMWPYVEGTVERDDLEAIVSEDRCGRLGLRHLRAP
jgi:threonine synthase